MNAGRLTYTLIPSKLEQRTDPTTGAVHSEWVDQTPMRAERVKIKGRVVLRGRETVTEMDAAYYVRIQHPIDTGWRVREPNGNDYDVVVEPNREKHLKLLQCTRVND